MIPDRPVVEFDAIYFQVLLFIVQLALVMELLVLVQHSVQLPFQLHLVLRVPAPLQYFIVFLDLLLSDECYLFQPLMLFVDPFVDGVPSFDQPAPGSSDAANSSVIQSQFVEDAFVHFRVVDSARLVDAAGVMDSAGVVLATALFLEALFLGHTLGTQIFPR